MYKHDIELSFPTANIDYAINSAKEQLASYKKENIEIGEAKEIRKGTISVKVSYTDNYEDVIFPSEDYIDISDDNGLKI